MIMQYMAAKNSHRYLHILPKIVDHYRGGVFKRARRQEGI